MSENPFSIFNDWLEAAIQTGMRDPNAMTLCTTTKSEKPSARIVLLKRVDVRGFTFFTNFNSQKGREILENPSVALVFYWRELNRQIRIEGQAEEVTAEEADAYFQSRHPESRLGAWASQQSSILKSRDELLERLEHFRNKFADKTIPRPPYWSGFRVIPMHIEFWEEGAFRLHTRNVYIRENTKKSWKHILLNP